MRHTAGKIDLTRGPIVRLSLRFALPICLGSMLQQLYSTVDTLVVGNFCGAASLAAVGTSSQPVELLLCIFLGLGTGVSILVSQYTGSGDQAQQRELVGGAVTFLYLCALPLTIAGLLLGPVLLGLMQVPADAWDKAVAYIQIMFLGTLGNMGYNMNAGILRGVGDSRATLYFLLLSCVVNIVLDLLFVAVFHMDADGAAWATIIAMYASWAASNGYLRRRYPELDFSPLPRRVDRRVLGKIVSVGLPLGLNNSFYSVGHIFLQTFINAQGSVFMAACSVGAKVNGLANIAIQALSSSATAFAGQNLGARQYGRLKKGGLRIPLASGLITGTAGLIVTLCCRPILALFTSDAQVLDAAARYVQIVLPFTWAYAVFNGIICFINGMGILRYPTIVNMLMLWAVRIPVAWLITRFVGGEYVMACYPISFVFGMLAMLAFFLSARWKEVRRLAEQEG